MKKPAPIRGVWLISGIIMLMGAVAALRLPTRRPPVEVEALRIQDMRNLGEDDIDFGYNDGPDDTQAVVMVVRNLNPGILYFDGQHKIMVREYYDWIKESHWVRPCWPFPDSKRPLWSICDCSPHEFLVYIEPGTQALHLSMEFQRYNLPDKAHLFASRYPWLDRQVLMPLLRQFGHHRTIEVISSHVKLRDLPLPAAKVPPQAHNPASAVDAPIASLFRIDHPWRRATDQRCSARGRSLTT